MYGITPFLELLQIFHKIVKKNLFFTQNANLSIGFPGLNNLLSSAFRQQALTSEIHFEGFPCYKHRR
uniref:Uncharacterized protein n=1 Tax=Romanomermis culicivorax TaxID=13658 RepID=A0A915I3Q6_ROMCU